MRRIRNAEDRRTLENMEERPSLSFMFKFGLCGWLMD